MTRLNDYDLYLFDADGTIIDTGELIYRCYRETCLKYGDYEIPRDDVIKYMGIPLTAMLRIFLPALTENELDEAGKFYIAHQLTIYTDFLQLFPGVKETLKALHVKGKKLGIVTSRGRDSLEKYINLLGIQAYFDFIVTPEDTREHKPHPEPVHKAMELAGPLLVSVPSPDKVLFVGDAEFDIQSGNRAGTDTALVLWGHNKPEDIASIPTHLLYSMKDLLL